MTRLSMRSKAERFVDEDDFYVYVVHLLPVDNLRIARSNGLS